MFDLGVTKMAVIGVVALVVLGPERLPRVARTAGALFGRAQRYINDVKAEVSREIELDSLRTMKSDFEQAARNVETSMQEQERSIRSAVQEHGQVVENALQAQTESLQEAWRGGDTAAAPGATLNPNSFDHSAPYDPAPAAYSAVAATGLQKRRGWRTRQAAQPLWYKRASQRRTYVQSGAARVARHKPASLRRPVSFF
jgi:sec-independent protein translocase protein TatB